MKEFNSTAQFNNWAMRLVKQGIREAVERGDDCWFEVDDDGTINISYEYVVACLPDFREPIEAVEMLYNFLRIGCYERITQNEIELITGGVIPLDHEKIIEVTVTLRSYFTCQCVDVFDDLLLSYWNRCVKELGKWPAKAN